MSALRPLHAIAGRCACGTVTCDCEVEQEVVLYTVRHFCASCCSPLFLFERDEPDVVEIAAGGIDEPDGIECVRDSKAYAASRPSWGSERADRDPVRACGAK